MKDYKKILTHFGIDNKPTALTVPITVYCYHGSFNRSIEYDPKNILVMMIVGVARLDGRIYLQQIDSQNYERMGAFAFENAQLRRVDDLEDYEETRFEAYKNALNRERGYLQTKLNSYQRNIRHDQKQSEDLERRIKEIKKALAAKE